MHSYVKRYNPSGFLTHIRWLHCLLHNLRRSTLAYYLRRHKEPFSGIALFLFRQVDCVRFFFPFLMKKFSSKRFCFKNNLSLKASAPRACLSCDESMFSTRTWSSVTSSKQLTCGSLTFLLELDVPRSFTARGTSREYRVRLLFAPAIDGREAEVNHLDSQRTAGPPGGAGARSTSRKGSRE